MRDHAIAVLGLGLVGGSLARDLAALGARVIGYDRDPCALAAAHHAGVIRTPLPADLAGIEHARTVVLAVPPSGAAGLLRAAGSRLDAATLITDVASTKASTERLAVELGIEARFVGSHPLAGDHHSGWAASRAGLFQQAAVFVCPTPATAASALAEAFALWRAVGATPRLSSARDHDALVAHVSHLPQLAAFALARVIAQGGYPATELGPGGRDTLRLAASDPDLWADIALDNAAQLLPLLERCRVELTLLQRTLRSGDRAALRESFAAAGRWRTAGSPR